VSAKASRLHDFPVMIPVAEAERIILSTAVPIASETISLTAARGRILAEPLASPVASPPFPQSSVDGFAVRCEDLANTKSGTEEVALRMLGELPAGSPWFGRLESMSTVRVMTGAMVPDGADAVVMQEDVRVEGTTAIFSAPILPGSNVRPRGDDFKEQSVLLESGVELGAAEMALAAASGSAQVSVRCGLRVHVVITGSELVAPGEKLEAGQIYDSNSTMFRELLRHPWVSSLAMDFAPDDPDALRRTLRQHLQVADFLLVVGGVSVGAYDFAQAILIELGVEPLFWKVRQRPGKPLFYGRQGSTSVFGVPGNPVSAWFCFHRYILLAMASRLGWRNGVGSTWELPLAEPEPRLERLSRFLRGRLSLRDGTLFFLPSSKQGSHQLSGLVGVTHIGEVPSGAGLCRRVHVRGLLPGFATSGLGVESS
jgi:molybdopterin molybdotransferase